MFSVLFTLTQILGPVAHAGACDAKALSAQVAAAGPQETSGLFLELAACDPASAKKVAQSAFGHMVSGAKANEAAVAAIKVGAGKETLAWLQQMQSDDRSQTVAALGDACGATPEVQRFFLDAAGSLGDAFWTQLWYRALAGCRVPMIQDLLTAEVSKGAAGGQSRFLGALEVYARNLGGAAVPRLTELAKAQTDEELQTYIINAYADAAGVGFEGGTNDKVAAEAVRSIVSVSDQLKPKALEQARTTLRALGDEAASDALAGVMYKDRKQADGKLIWGAVVVETATCKNAKVSQAVHVGQLLDGGQTWPDQLRAKAETVAGHSWDLTLAEKCKGEGKVDYILPVEPFADGGAFKAWADEQVREAQRQTADKRVKVEHDPLNI